jgi:hypothetical protein
MAEEKKKDEDWMQKKWRPAMGWMYMVVCFFDMVIFPILWALIQTVQHQQLVQWNPLTLQGAGLFHIAMGAVLGIAAFGRTQEKIAGSATNVTPTTTTPPTTPTFGAAMPAAPSVPAATFAAPAFGAAPAPAAGFGAGFPGDPPVRNTRNDG